MNRYGHCHKLAEKVLEGLKSVDGVDAQLYQVNPMAMCQILTTMRREFIPPLSSFQCFSLS